MSVKPASDHTLPNSSSGTVTGYSLAGHIMSATKPEPGLYLVATPIGNLGDITLRALETLAGVDVIACEDSRITRRLLDRFLIKTPLTPYHDHNAAAVRPRLLERLARGAAIALVSDAGTPLVSDPGYKLVRDVCAAGHQVIALPGPSSVLAALSVAGLPTDRFFFEGFLPPKELARRNRIHQLARVEATVIVFESGSRIVNCLRELGAIIGDREAAVCREMTKLHEEIRRAPLARLAETAAEMETRGEFVIVIAPPDASSQFMPEAELDRILRTALETDSVKDAVAYAVELSGRSRRDVYARALELAKTSRPEQDEAQDEPKDEPKDEPDDEG